MLITYQSFGEDVGNLEVGRDMRKGKMLLSKVSPVKWQTTSIKKEEEEKKRQYTMPGFRSHGFEEVLAFVFVYSIVLCPSVVNKF